jgi:hypothetical protein
MTGMYLYRLSYSKLLIQVRWQPRCIMHIALYFQRPLIPDERTAYRNLLLVCVYSSKIASCFIKKLKDHPIPKVKEYRLPYI